MAESTDTSGLPTNDSAGHLSVHVEGAHPAQQSFLFEQRQSRVGPAFAGSLASHAAIILALIFLVRYGNRTTSAEVKVPELTNKDIVWLSEPGPGGGGGGGGNRMKEPPRQAEMPGKDKVTVPVEKPPKLEMTEAKKEPDPVAMLNIPGEEPRRGAGSTLPGAIEAPPGPPTLVARFRQRWRSRHRLPARARRSWNRIGPWTPAAAVEPAAASISRVMASTAIRVPTATLPNRTLHLRRDAREDSGRRDGRSLHRGEDRLAVGLPHLTLARLDVRARSTGRRRRATLALPPRHAERRARESRDHDRDAVHAAIRQGGRVGLAGR